MHRQFVLLTALIAALAGTAMRAATPLNRLVGSDTIAMISVDDLGTLQKNWLQSPFGRTWNDPQMIKFLAPLREAMQIDAWDNRCRARTGRSVDELAAGFGSMVLLVTDFTGMIEDKTHATPPGLLLAVDLRDDRDALVKVIEEESQKSQKTYTTEEFQGETLHIKAADGPRNCDCWAVVGNVLFAGPDKAIVQKAIADYKRGGSESPFVETDRYRDEARRLPDAQIRVLVNMERVVATLRAAARNSAAPQAAAPQSPTPETIISALGLDTFRVISIACRIGDKDTTLAGSVTYDEPRGLARLFSSYTDGAAPEPTFITGDWSSVSAARFRLGGLYDAIEEIIRGIGPSADGPFEAWIADMNKRAGIDIKRDIFCNFGDEMYNATRLESPKTTAGLQVPQARQLFVLSLNDPKAFAGALEALKNTLLGPAAAQMFRTRDYLNTTICTMVKPRAPGGDNKAPVPPPEPVFAYAVTQRHLVLGIGGDDFVEMAIQNLITPQPSYWSRPGVKAALGKLPAGADSYGYADLHKLVPTYIDIFAQVMLMSPLRVRDGHIVTGEPPPPAARPMPRSTDDGPASPPPGGDEEEQPAETPPPDPGRPIIDMNAKPTAESIAAYWDAMASATYHDARGFHSIIRLEYPK